MRSKLTILLFLSTGLPMLCGQQLASGSAAQPGLTIDLHDALARARQYGTQIQSANIAAALAREDRAQAKAGTLPSVNAFNQFIYTEGNGTPSGVFVANDGVHVYNEYAIVHEELLSPIRRGELRLTAAALAVASAKADVAARGLNATVVQDYYAIVSAVRKIRNAETSRSEAQRFLTITQDQEKGGEAAHADVIKAQLQVQQRERDLQDAQLAADKAKIALAVLIFPSLQIDYSVTDDAANLGVLPPPAEASRQASAGNPDLLAARASLTQSHLAVSVARYAYLPSFALDFFYGIDANQFTDHTDHPTPESGRSTLPNYLVSSRQNLGYVAQATLNIPVWDWGTIRSRVRQAALRERQSSLDLTVAEKQVQAESASAYKEAQSAFGQVDSLRGSSDLAAESLRLTLLRYQAGEATTLEVVDAQTTANLSRAAYDDGLIRYRIALANLQILTGTFQ